jgi:hypothetical protein
MSEPNPEAPESKPTRFDAYHLMVVWLFLATLAIGLTTYYSVYNDEKGEQGPPF